MDFRRRSPVTWPSVGAAGGSGGAIRRQSHCEDEAKNKKIKKICSYALARTKAAAAKLSKKAPALAVLMTMSQMTGAL